MCFFFLVPSVFLDLDDENMNAGFSFWFSLFFGRERVIRCYPVLLLIFLRDLDGAKKERGVFSLVLLLGFFCTERRKLPMFFFLSAPSVFLDLDDEKMKEGFSVRFF